MIRKLCTTTEGYRSMKIAPLKQGKIIVLEDELREALFAIDAVYKK